MPTRIVSAFIETDLKDCLKARRYKRFRFVWNRQINGFTHVIEIQDQQGVQLDSATFTLNVGVFVPTVFEVVWGKPRPKWTRDVDCVSTERIGRLMPDGQEKWWKIDASTDMTALSKEIEEAINLYADSFFEKMKDLASIRRHMLEQNDDTNSYRLRRIYLAMIEFMLGDVEGAMKLINSLEGDEVWKGRAERVKQFITSRGSEPREALN